MRPSGAIAGDRLRMAVRESGRPAVTHYRVLERFRAHTYLSVQLETGRTHQIRLHLSHLKYPIVGDPVYGGRFAQPRGAAQDAHRHFARLQAPGLACGSAGVRSPRTGKRVALQSPVPEDFAQLLRALRDDARLRRAARSARGDERLARGRLAGASAVCARCRPCAAMPAAASARRPMRASIWAITSATIPTAVAENRRRLKVAAGLPREPSWLVSGAWGSGRGLCDLAGEPPGPADAAVARRHRARSARFSPLTVCPSVFATDSGDAVAAAHAGWRGLAAGVIEATVRAMDVPLGKPRGMAGSGHRTQAFRGRRGSAGGFLSGGSGGRRGLRAERAGTVHGGSGRCSPGGDCKALGVSRVYGGGECTFAQADRYFSHRRDGITGRQATLIWREA